MREKALSGGSFFLAQATFPLPVFFRPGALFLNGGAALKQKGGNTDGRKLTHELFGLVLMFLSLLLLLSLLSFSADDPSLNYVTSAGMKVRNKAGLFGAYMAGFMNDVFGVASFVWPVCLGGLGAGFISLRFDFRWWRWCGHILLGLCFLAAGTAWDFSLGDVRGGGMLGGILFNAASLYLSPVGSGLLLLFVLLIATQLSFDISWMTLFHRVWEAVRTAFAAGRAGNLHLPRVDRAWGAVLERIRGKTGPMLARLRAWRASRAAARPAPMPVVAETRPADFEPLERPFVSFADMPPAEPERGGDAEVSGVPAAAAVAEEERGLESDREAAAPVADAPDAGSAPAPAPAIPADSAEDESQPLPVPVTAAEDVELIYTEGGTVAPHDGEGQAVSVSRPAEGPRRKALVPFPPLDLLSPPEAHQPVDEHREERGRLLVDCLADFGVEGRLERITPGPVVTMYEYKPAAGVRVRRIENLVDDVARALRAKSIRIQAPIPGSDTVGIEIPNEHREMVNFREILGNAAFTQAASPLTMIIGKDIAGRPFTADLAVMPHLLVAGATGQGKSVCINSILMSFLYKARPEELQLLLVDPKRVEFAVYAELPHLVHPVVTEMDQAKAALDWALHEMEQRYDALARLGVRNITGYNEKLKKQGSELPPELSDLAPMPYLVIIIDEFADLMMTAARREVENSIVRLAQLARAAGIHMILATQRPSVDVVTGLIKANFPCRISFRVSQKVDSRTILDAMGAEALLGKGDMLFKPSSGRMLRMHGPFVSDDEVAGVVQYWKRQQKPNYQVNFAEWGAEEAAAEAGRGGGGDDTSDALYPEILAFVNEQGKASISLIQRRFKIGFNRAARLFEQLERDGVVGPADGSSKPRSVVR